MASPDFHLAVDTGARAQPAGAGPVAAETFHPMNITSQDIIDHFRAIEAASGIPELSLGCDTGYYKIFTACVRGEYSCCGFGNTPLEAVEAFKEKRAALPSEAKTKREAAAKLMAEAEAMEKLNAPTL